jgi:hypothetical protein
MSNNLKLLQNHFSKKFADLHLKKLFTFFNNLRSFFGNATNANINKESKNEPTAKLQAKDRFCDGLNLSLGTIFKTTREALGVSIEEVSRNLKVKTRYIIAIEQDSFHQMNEHPYFAGFVKSYAKMLKIKDETVEEYLKNIVNNCNTKNKKHQLLNLDNEQVKNPSKDDLVNAILIFTMIYLLLISFSQFKTQNLAITDLIINQLNQAQQ